MNEIDATPEQWIEDHSYALYRYALSLVRDSSVAEDLVQDTLLAGWRSAKRFRGESNPRTWLSGILRHKAMDHFRRSFREESYQQLPDSGYPAQDLFNQTGRWKESLSSWSADPHQALESAEFREVLSDCLSRLDDRKRTAITLQAFGDLSTGQICKELGVTPTNLWVLAHRGRESLRRCLEKNWFRRM